MQQDIHGIDNAVKTLEGKIAPNLAEIHQWCREILDNQTKIPTLEHRVDILEDDVFALKQAVGK